MYLKSVTLFPFKPALNTSTLIPFALGVNEQIHTAAKAGYQGIITDEWLRGILLWFRWKGKVRQSKSLVQMDCGTEVI